MRVLVAFDKFKDSISAEEACRAAAEALGAAHPDWELDICPLADGGEGFASILTGSAGGRLQATRVEGPRGGVRSASWGLVPMDRVPLAARAILGAQGTVALVEMASASGLALLAPGERDLLRSSSVGTGQLLRAAADTGAGAILLGVGGSATHDLGLGALGALGLRFSFADGTSLSAITPGLWPRLRGVEGAVEPRLPPVVIACDVDNPVLGPRGSLATYGRQKGIAETERAAVERETGRVLALLCGHFGRPAELGATPGAGAAGGIALGLMVAAGARLVPGIDLVSAWLDLEGRIGRADLVLTGEGRFDASSLQGKGPGAVARRAIGAGKAVRIFAGEVAAGTEAPGATLCGITPEGMPLAEALAAAAPLLRSAVRRNLA